MAYGEPYATATPVPHHGAPPLHGYGAPTGFRRPPTGDECRMCGYAPATKVTFQHTYGMVVLVWFSAYSGYYCRLCSLAMFREATAKNLVGFWWGVLSLAAGPIFLVMNLYYHQKATRLAFPSYRDPAVSTPADRPLVPGPPVFQRPLVLGALVLVMLIAVVGSVAAVAQ